MTQLDFNSKKGFICDMDGVIYHGNIVLPGVHDFINWLNQEKKEYHQIIMLKEEIDNEKNAYWKSKELIIYSNASKELNVEYKSYLEESYSLYPSCDVLIQLQSL